MYKAPLTVAGIIFAIVAFVHLYRLYDNFLLIVGTTVVPLWVNIVGLIVDRIAQYLDVLRSLLLRHLQKVDIIYGGQPKQRQLRPQIKALRLRPQRLLQQCLL